MVLFISIKLFSKTMLAKSEDLDQKMLKAVSDLDLPTFKTRDIRLIRVCKVPIQPFHMRLIIMEIFFED